METKELIEKLREISNMRSASNYKRTICKMAAQRLERLAAYEETGLEPEAVSQLKQICEIFNCSASDPAQLKQLLAKLQSWGAAEQDGRLVVLPCKVGDRVFSGYGNPLDISVSKTNGDCVTHVKISRRGYLFKCWWGCFRISDIGKTVFLTRAEAEAALKGGKAHGQRTDAQR